MDRDGESVCFFDVMERARQMQEIAIGYKLRGHGSPILNPKDKDDPCLSTEEVESFILLGKDYC